MTHAKTLMAMVPVVGIMSLASADLTGVLKVDPISGSLNSGMLSSTINSPAQSFTMSLGGYSGMAGINAGVVAQAVSRGPWRCIWRSTTTHATCRPTHHCK